MPVLVDIVERKCRDVAARMAQTPLAVLERLAEPTTRRFAEALKQPGLRFILECKKASPSEGLIRPDFDMKKIVEVYRGFADAVSVLTDEPFFQGSFANLEIARAALPQPILCKDFIVDPYQVFEARAHGADAVLLMLSVQDDATYRRCAEAAKALAMEVLTEVHDEEELIRALKLEARVIGINNRDLKTMKVDLTTTRKLAAKIPRDSLNERAIVSESGIKSRADIDELGEVVDAFLVGSRLMKEARLDLAVRSLIFGRVKICGLTSAEAARAAYEAGASWGGMIFAPESPRCVSETKAREIASASPLPMVGVFVNDAPEKIARLAHELHFAAAQLHGEESAETINKLRRALPSGCEIWKAVRVGEMMPSVEMLLKETGADRLLLDAFHPSIRGGVGDRFDWVLLKQLPESLLSRMIIAGGVTPENVQKAHRLECCAVDVNSGVESSPGQKDTAAIQCLFSRLRGSL
ncbi:MAG: bifunctional indole-3-glycerol-phosphate synthase TrpC/phosphoribosylanthranilate isomerase TrpF [Burkholderiales bacterium]|jgi:indole-3-glycerol phosphate synthase/phosphoribosylanthranilate isomerase|nr:bifunctional indole-3-glycerol-phosphate synthase TrpC/phosphoribosylanthranilate isomerase TrpF [Burkholderiales bacterium]